MMAIGRPRRRRRSGNNVLVLLVLIGVTGTVGAALWAGYSTLTKDLRHRNMALVDRVSALERSLEQASRARGQLAMALEETRARLKYAETRYDRDVPSGPALALHELTARLLDNGVMPARLGFLLRQAERPLDCDSPTERRLRLGVEDTGVEADTLRLADGDLQVSGRGNPARDQAGRPEAWFDPSAPVTLTVTPTERGAEATTLSGVLPLSGRIALEGAEYRLEAVSGPPGMVALTGQRCAYQ